MVKLEQPRPCWGVSLECIQAWSDLFLANWDVPGSPSALLLIQNEQSSWIHEPLQLGPYLEVTVFTSAQAGLTYSCVWNSLCQKSLFVCKRVSELGSHNLQNNVFHIFNYCTDLLCMGGGGYHWWELKLPTQLSVSYQIFPDMENYLFSSALTIGLH